MVAALIMGAAIRPCPVFVKETESVERLGRDRQDGRTRRGRLRGSFGIALLARYLLTRALAPIVSRKTHAPINCKSHADILLGTTRTPAIETRLGFSCFFKN